MYTTFPEIPLYKIWESSNYQKLNDYDYGYPKRHSQQSNKKPKHKYQVNDLILDVNNDRVGIIRKLLSWPNYLIVNSSTPTKSWICNEAHIEPLADDFNDIDKSSPSIDDYWEEEQEPTLCPLYNPLSTKITDITDTEDITISKKGVDLTNDGGESTISSIKRVDDDINDLRCLSDINMQKTINIEVKTHDIEQRMCDIEKRQKKISKLSKLALLSRLL